MAPVFFTTLSIIILQIDSISESIKVLFFGCKVTEMATDFFPSGIPSPS